MITFPSKACSCEKRSVKYRLSSIPVLLSKFKVIFFNVLLKENIRIFSSTSHSYALEPVAKMTQAIISKSDEYFLLYLLLKAKSICSIRNFKIKICCSFSLSRRKLLISLKIFALNCSSAASFLSKFLAKAKRFDT